MNKHFKTEQEEFWANEFGNEYINRNDGSELIASNLALFARALRSTHSIHNCIEFGANIGFNLIALKHLFPNMEQHAIEINSQAAEKLSQVTPPPNIFQTSILEFQPTRSWDLVLIKGVLIHINPEWLPQVYDTLYKATKKYLLLCEYYNPSPVSINYRGHNERLFKRDFCGEMLDRYSDLKLVDYGFVYRRDPNFRQDDITWFLIEKYF